MLYAQRSELGLLLLALQPFIALRMHACIVAHTAGYVRESCEASPLLTWVSLTHMHMHFAHGAA